MKTRNIRGLSPVIASVLLIMLVLFLAALIFLWARGFISEQIEKGGRPIDEYCSNVRIEVHKIGTDKLQIINTGDVDIFSFDFKLTKGGSSEVKNYDYAVNAGGDGLEVDVTLDDYDEFIAYPVLLGTVVGEDSNMPFTCLDSGFKVD